MADKKVKMTVEMELTVPQALAVQAMFEKWNSFSNMGHSSNVAFLVDGDGNFHPNCVIKTDTKLPELTDELRKLALVEETEECLYYDFDDIAWKLDE